MYEKWIYTVRPRFIREKPEHKIRIVDHLDLLQYNSTSYKLSGPKEDEFFGVFKLWNSVWSTASAQDRCEICTPQP